MARREALEWNQGDLADKAGVHVNIIKKIETDNGEGSLETRRAIAGALKCTLSDLYKDAEDTVLDAAGVADFLSTFANLPRVYQKVILAIAYKDPSRLDGLPDSVKKPLLVLLKAR